MTAKRPYDEYGYRPVSDPPDIEGLSGEESQETAIEEVKAWFLENFEDPAERTPYESAEGGYQYIHDGPYEVRDIIDSFLPHIDGELREKIISEIERDGDVWVPNGSREEPPYDDDPTLIEEQRNAAFIELQERVAALEKAFALLPEPQAGMGHNRPPKPIVDEPLDAKDRLEIKAALHVIKAQLAEPDDKGKAAVEAGAKIETKIESCKTGLWENR